MRMRQLFSVGKILLLLVLAWLLVLVFVGGPLIRGSDGQEEILAKRLVESQGEVAALRRERDALARNLRTMGKGEQVMMIMIMIMKMMMMIIKMMIMMMMMMMKMMMMMMMIS